MSTPREKMISQGASELSLPELIALILSSGSRGESVFSMSARIASDYGIEGIASRGSVHELMKGYGMGRARACQLSAALELGRRLYDCGSREFPILRNPQDSARYLEPMGRLGREQFRCLYLNTQNRVIRDEVISIGSLNASLVHPREVFHFAIQYSAASLILAHNHPGGGQEPSAEDIALTRQLQEVSRVMGIGILDHLIIVAGGWFSFQENGLMGKPGTTQSRFENAGQTTTEQSPKYQATNPGVAPAGQGVLPGQDNAPTCRGQL